MNEILLADAKVRAALHAPTSKQWAGSIPYPFLGDPVNGFDTSECFCVAIYLTVD